MLTCERSEGDQSAGAEQLDLLKAKHAAVSAHASIGHGSAIILYQHMLLQNAKPIGTINDCHVTITSNCYVHTTHTEHSIYHDSCCCCKIVLASKYTQVATKDARLHPVKKDKHPISRADLHALAISCQTHNRRAGAMMIYVFICRCRAVSMCICISSCPAEDRLWDCTCLVIYTLLHRRKLMYPAMSNVAFPASS